MHVTYKIKLHHLTKLFIFVGSGTKAVVPNIHIISADKRLKDMMKKAKQDKRNATGATSSKSSSSSSLALSSAKSSQDKSLLYKIKSGVE